MQPLVVARITAERSCTSSPRSARVCRGTDRELFRRSSAGGAKRELAGQPSWRHSWPSLLLGLSSPFGVPIRRRQGRAHGRHGAPVDGLHRQGRQARHQPRAPPGHLRPSDRLPGRRRRVRPSPPDHQGDRRPRRPGPDLPRRAAHLRQLAAVPAVPDRRQAPHRRPDPARRPNPDGAPPTRRCPAPRPDGRAPNESVSVGGMPHPDGGRLLRCTPYCTHCRLPGR